MAGCQVHVAHGRVNVGVPQHLFDLKDTDSQRTILRSKTSGYASSPYIEIPNSDIVGSIRNRLRSCLAVSGFALSSSAFVNFLNSLGPSTGTEYEFNV